MFQYISTYSPPASYVKFSTVASHPSFVILSRLNDDDDCVMFPGNNREVSSINVLAGRSQLGLFGDIQYENMMGRRHQCQLILMRRIAALLYILRPFTLGKVKFVIQGGTYIGLLLREYLKYLNHSSGIFIIIYSVDRLTNKNLHHVYFVKKNLGLQNLSLSTATYKFWQQHFYQGKY